MYRIQTKLVYFKGIGLKVKLTIELQSSLKSRILQLIKKLFT